MSDWPRSSMRLFIDQRRQGWQGWRTRGGSGRGTGHPNLVLETNATTFF